MLRVVHASHCPEIGPICNYRDEPPQLHDQTLRILQLQLGATWGFTDELGLEVRAPLKLVDTGIVYRQLDGTPFVPDFQNIHHRDETLVGVVDPWVMGRGTFDVGGFQFRVGVGVSLPVGRTEPDPFLAGERGEVHQHIQFGSGTVRPVGLVEVLRRVGPVDAAWYGQGQWSLDENGHGFRAGSAFATGLSGDVAITGALRGRLGLELLNEGAERWNGVVKQDGNLGRTDLLLGVGLSYPLGASTLRLTARVPVWQHVVGGQLSYPALVESGVTTR